MFMDIVDKREGTIQVDMGRGRGKLHIYLAKLGMPGGNARLTVGSLSKLVSISTELLRSAWFHDSSVGASTQLITADKIFQPAGTATLPALIGNTATPLDLAPVLDDIFR